MSREDWKNKWVKPVIKHNTPTEWNWVVGYPEYLDLGMRVDIGAFTYIDARYGVVIEDDVQIGGGVHIYSHNTIDGTEGRVVLKKGCKIGAHSVILPGVTVGENAKVGAFSLVKEDIPANSTAYGITAKVKYPISR